MPLHSAQSRKLRLRAINNRLLHFAAMHTTPPVAALAPRPEPLRFLRIREVLARVGLSKSALYARIRAGAFPRPVQLGTMSLWVESEIDECMAARIAERDASSALADAITVQLQKTDTRPASRKYLISWWAVQGSNLRPLPCEGNALPLS